jgi:hypothetical protein
MTGQDANGTILQRAVTQNHALSRQGFSERLFAWLFKGLVYPQIWEDPEVDMVALAIQPGHRIVTIASGGCNALSYLTADPARVEAVDLNRAHVAFNRLKLAALKHLPDYATFYRFYGKADDKANLAAYQRFIRPHLDQESRAYWEKRKLSGRQRIVICIVTVFWVYSSAWGTALPAFMALTRVTFSRHAQWKSSGLSSIQHSHPCLKNAWYAGPPLVNHRCLALAFRRSNMMRWQPPAMATWLSSFVHALKNSPAPFR